MQSPITDQQPGDHSNQPAGTGSNIDPREVEQFAHLSSEWWDPEGPFRMLHRIGLPRLQYIRDAATRHFDLEKSVRQPFQSLTCLDIGCGGGLISEPMTRLGGRVSAIDPAGENIAAARRHAAAVGLSIDYRAASAEEVAAAGETYDLVTCLEVIEHVPDPQAFVATLVNLVKPGGLIVLSTLNRTPKSYALAIIGAEYVLGWLPRGTHDWTRFVTPDELEAHCKRAGLTEFTSEGINYDVLRDQWQRSKDTGVNYMASAVRPYA